MLTGAQGWGLWTKPAAESLLYLMGVKHLNKDLNFDTSIPTCKMVKWDQQEAGESAKENMTQE